MSSSRGQRTGLSEWGTPSDTSITIIVVVVMVVVVVVVVRKELFALSHQVVKSSLRLEILPVAEFELNRPLNTSPR